MIQTSLVAGKFDLVFIYKQTLIDVNPSESSVKRLKKRWGIKGTRSQKHTLESISGPITELKTRYSMAGARKVTEFLRTQFDMHVPEYVKPVLALHQAR